MWGIINKMLFREQVSEVVQRAAAEAGFDLAGAAPVRAEEFPETAAFVEWIDAGHAGEMKYMEKRTESGELRRGPAEKGGPSARPAGGWRPEPNPAQPYSTKLNSLPPRVY